MSYPYRIVLSATEMEKAVGILRLHGYGLDEEMCNSRNYIYRNDNFNGSGKSAVYFI